MSSLRGIVGRPVFLLDVVGRSSGERRPVMLLHSPHGDEAWALAAVTYPGFDSYRRFTDRRIPVAVLERRPGRS